MEPGVVLKTNWQVCEWNGVMSTETGCCLAKEESLAKAKRTENEVEAGEILEAK